MTWRTLYRDAQYSDRDPLTGLFNRRGIVGAVGDLFESTRDDSSCLAFVVVDIDKFKTVNDLHGHAEGDHVIRRTANRLSTHLGERGAVGSLRRHPHHGERRSGGASAILAATNVADSMMYQAKAAGGNTIRSAQI
ncbi:GGDEF domain-containing protein [Rhodococcus erythropolis]|uniref:GGDEF domain-containing protein n=1 Tax=Rhodococcus erythropolis TaxID=1833 RepID=UPI00294A53CE|nr:GGDEF domain-containing protein [Rhodococcus erythropolis]MDV6276424.1 GGDEF domain-containing protein [Rhodococcus erythropolis]